MTIFSFSSLYKWHNELSCTYGTDFWDRTYQLTKGIKHENKMKWLQFQINRNSLFTNVKVCKFDSSVSALCCFCSDLDPPGNHRETISHLFYDCDIVLTLLLDVRAWLETCETFLPLDRNKILFGLHTDSANSVINYVILSLKYFIWVKKQQSQTPTLTTFKPFLKCKLDDLKDTYNYQNKDNLFCHWTVIYDNLSGQI